jgi:hypothetical protein
MRGLAAVLVRASFGLSFTWSPLARKTKRKKKKKKKKKRKTTRKKPKHAPLFLLPCQHLKVLIVFFRLISHQGVDPTRLSKLGFLLVRRPLGLVQLSLRRRRQSAQQPFQRFLESRKSSSETGNKKEQKNKEKKQKQNKNKNKDKTHLRVGLGELSIHGCDKKGFPGPYLFSFRFGLATWRFPLASPTFRCAAP